VGEGTKKSSPELAHKREIAPSLLLTRSLAPRPFNPDVHADMKERRRRVAVPATLYLPAQKGWILRGY